MWRSVEENLEVSRSKVAQATFELEVGEEEPDESQKEKNYVKKMTPPLLKLNVLNRFESHKIKNHDVGCHIGTGKVWI